MSKRVSALDATLRALGAEMEEWNDMDVPISYPIDPDDERDAVRNAIGMWDTSALKSIRVRGPDALATVDHLATRTMSKIYVGKSAYTPILKDDGHFCDDAYIYHVKEDEFIVVHGTGQTKERVQESAEGKNVEVEFDDDTHMISVQGPKSIDLLDANASADLRAVKFCHQVDTALFGTNVMISRTGFSGERGYEVFTPAKDAAAIWQQLMEHGKPMGLLPVDFTGLDKVHVESALLFYGAEATEENTPWEVNCAWAVSRKKGDFRGKDALFALEGKEKIKLCGIEAEHDGALDPESELLIDGDNVGHITSAAYLRSTGKSLALVHLTPSVATEGTRLTVKSKDVECAASVVRTPFIDPEKKHLHAA